MNLSPEREKVVTTPRCSNRALTKSPSTVVSVAFCMASAWCELRQRSVSALWHPEQTWPPTNFAGSSASTWDVMSHKVSAMAAVAARRTNAVTSAEAFARMDAPDDASETEGACKDRPPHIDIEAQISAAAGLVIEVEAAIAEVQVEPWVGGIIDRADDLPIDMSADPKPADIPVGGQTKAVAVFPVIAPA